jgi:acyl-CoA synthetase (AMP-forming)/AMP-acid ligase II
MKMRQIDPQCLRSLVLGAADAPARFIADETTRLDLAALAQAAPRSSLAKLRGKTVLLALARQIETAAALIELDGVARRIVLWPHDLPAERMDAVLAAAGVDFVVSVWPPPGAEFHHGAATGATRAATISAEMEKSATEWVLFTSGTTGQPKLVVHTLNSLAGHLFGGAPSGIGPIWCTFYDIRRYGGMQILLRALIGAGSLVLSCPDETPGAFLERAASAGATHFLGTPSHWRRALMTEAADRISPEYVRLSGEVADQVILDKLRQSFPSARIVHAFASTEAGLAFEVADGQAGFPAELVGQPSAAAEIRIEGQSLRVRSPRNAIGYLDGVISAIPDQEGFVDTGDIVALHGDRYHFAGRRDGTVNVGGQKVHPEEVEAVINQHPAVEMSRVSARANPITGAVVVADIVCRPTGPGVTPAYSTPAMQSDVRDFCRARLAPHKVPAAIRIVASLDIAPSGKLVRMRA